jgi:hypothetical protein
LLFLQIDLFDGLQPHKNSYCFSYLAAVTITGDKAANLLLCLALVRVLFRTTPAVKLNIHDVALFGDCSMSLFTAIWIEMAKDERKVK